MKLLGFVFLIVLLVTAVGYFRGWFSITTSHAMGKSGMEVTIDGEKFDDDKNAVTKQIAAVVTEPDTAAAPATREFEGELTVVDVAARNLTVTVGTRTIVQHVATAVAITRDAVSIGLDELRADMRARFVFDGANEPRALLRIEILR